MNKKIVTIILALILLSTVPVYWLKLAFDNVILRDVLYLVAVFSAVAGGIFAISKYGIKQARGLTLLLITSGIGFLLIGELVFEYYFIVLKHDIPFPSLMDIFYLLTYPLLLGGLYNEIRLADVNYKKLNKKIWAILITVALVLAYVVYQWGIIAAYDPAENLFTNVIAMSYSVGDLFLIMTTLFLAVLVKEYSGGRFAKIWLFMMTGFCFLLAGDILSEFFREEYHNEVWFWKSLLDTFGMAGYICYAKALFDFGFSIQDAFKEIEEMKKSNDLPKHQLSLTTKEVK